MSGFTLVWLGGAMVVFLTATSILRSYATAPHLPSLIGALFLYCVGNLMMIRVLRDSGMAIAVSVSSVLQLVLGTLIAVWLFGERPTLIQWTGIALGVVAVALIVWPQEGAR
ncbi:MAG: EamA family transporter [Rhodobacterales bacterium]|nr:EamA family transporter [Rhodobacterales bacterium]